MLPHVQLIFTGGTISMEVDQVIGAAIPVRSGEQILVNRIPVRKFYRKTMEGVLELAGSGWKKLTGNG